MAGFAWRMGEYGISSWDAGKYMILAPAFNLDASKIDVSNIRTITKKSP